jgi:hypothetical protein
VKIFVCTPYISTIARDMFRIPPAQFILIR